MAAIHDVQSVVVPIVLAVQKDPADQKVLALVGHKCPFGCVPQVHSFDGDILAFAEVNEFRPLGDPVILRGVLEESQMDLVQEIQGTIESPAVDDSFAFHGDILLPFGEKEPIVALDHVIVVRVGRPDQDGPFQQSKLHVGFKVDAAGQIAPDTEFKDSSAVFADEVNSGLDRSGVECDSVGFDAERGCLMDFLGYGRDHGKKGRCQ